MVKQHHVVLNDAEQFRFRLPQPGSIPSRVAYVPLPSIPNSSLFQNVNLIDRFVPMSDMPRTRANSSTTAQPDASSSAASPLPRPSMCAETMYISPGVAVPDLGGVNVFKRPAGGLEPKPLDVGIPEAPQLFLNPVEGIAVALVFPASDPRTVQVL